MGWGRGDSLPESASASGSDFRHFFLVHIDRCAVKAAHATRAGCSRGACGGDRMVYTRLAWKYLGNRSASHDFVSRGPLGRRPIRSRGPGLLALDHRMRDRGGCDCDVYTNGGASGSFSFAESGRGTRDARYGRAAGESLQSQDRGLPPAVVRLSPREAGLNPARRPMRAGSRREDLLKLRPMV